MKTSTLVTDFCKGLIETKEKQAIEQRVFTNFGEYKLSNQIEFGTSLFLFGNSVRYSTMKYTSIPYIVDTAWITVKNDIDEFQKVKVTGRGKGAETNMVQHMTTFNGKSILEIYGLQNNSYGISSKRVNVPKPKPIAKICLPRNLETNHYKVMIKDGTISKFNDKFKLHLAVSVRKTLLHPVKMKESIEIVKEPLLRKGFKKHCTNGFVPFKYESGRGLPVELGSITNFGGNILWKKNPAFVSDTTKKRLGIIALDPGVKTFLSGVSEVGDEFLFCPQVPGYLKNLQLVKQDLQTQIDLQRNLDPNSIQKLQDVNDIKRQYYQEIRAGVELSCNWLQLISKAESDYHRYKSSIGSSLESEMNKILHRKHRAVRKLHNICCMFLAHWKHVVLPEFSLNTFAKSNTMGKKTKTILASLSHGAFRVKLKRQLLQRQHCLLNGGEDWSTKICNKCYHTNHPGLSRVYSCCNEKCRHVIRRDTNGASNILLFTITRIIQWIHQKPSSAPVSNLLLIQN